MHSRYIKITLYKFPSPYGDKLQFAFDSATFNDTRFPSPYGDKLQY